MSSVLTKRLVQISMVAIVRINPLRNDSALTTQLNICHHPVLKTAHHRTLLYLYDPKQIFS